MKSLLFLILFFTVSCTSLFYYPSKEEFYDVDTTRVSREEVLLTTSDGIQLHGWYFPQVKKSKGLVLLFHGNAENITSHFVNLFWLVEADYEYAIFDYRGYGKSGGSVNNDKSLLDIETMMQWGAKKATERSLPFIVYGQSLGATLSLKYLSRHPEFKPQMIVIESPFFAFTEVARLKAKETWLLWALQPLVPLLISDKNSLTAEELQALPPYPKIFIHSENDPVVPFSQGKKVFTLASEPKEFWTYKAPYHVYGTHTEEGKYRKLLLQRMEKLAR